MHLSSPARDPCSCSSRATLPLNHIDMIDVCMGPRTREVTSGMPPGVSVPMFVTAPKKSPGCCAKYCSCCALFLLGWAAVVALIYLGAFIGRDTRLVSEIDVSSIDALHADWPGVSQLDKMFASLPPAPTKLPLGFVQGEWLSPRPLIFGYIQKHVLTPAFNKQVHGVSARAASS